MHIPSVEHGHAMLAIAERTTIAGAIIDGIAARSLKGQAQAGDLGHGARGELDRRKHHAY
jgi:hypothetical protein